MKNQIKQSSVIILAGGNSSRMGYPKLWIQNKNGISFLSSIINNYKKCGFSKIVVVINEEFTTIDWKEYFDKIDTHTLIVKNKEQDKGRLHSLYLGLKTIDTDFFYIHNVDNPFVEKEIITLLLEEKITNGVTIPSYREKGGHPVIISNVVKKEIVTNYKNYNTLKEIFSNFPKRYVQVESSSILKNINTPEELEASNYEFA